VTAREKEELFGIAARAWLLHAKVLLGDDITEEIKDLAERASRLAESDPEAT